MRCKLSHYTIGRFFRFTIYTSIKFWINLMLLAVIFINLNCESKNQVQTTSIKSKLEDPANAAVIKKINSISPNIYVDSNGSIVTTNASYEEMRELALLLSVLGDSVNFLFPKKHEIVKDGRDRIVSKKEKGFETIYEYPDSSINNIPSSSKTQKVKETAN